MFDELGGICSTHYGKVENVVVSLRAHHGRFQHKISDQLIVTFAYMERSFNVVSLSLCVRLSLSHSLNVYKQNRIGNMFFYWKHTPRINDNRKYLLNAIMHPDVTECSAFENDITDVGELDMH